MIKFQFLGDCLNYLHIYIDKEMHSKQANAEFIILEKYPVPANTLSKEVVCGELIDLGHSPVKDQCNPLNECNT